VPYKPNLDVITGGEPFFLGMADTPGVPPGLRHMHEVTPAEDLPVLGEPRPRRGGGAGRGAAEGEVEVVGLVRRVSFGLHARYFGVPEPEKGQARRLGDAPLRVPVRGLARERHGSAGTGGRDRPRLPRPYRPAEIARRKAGGTAPEDDVLARCLRRQAEGLPGYE
jgi:hypothetical protein